MERSILNNEITEKIHLLFRILLVANEKDYSIETKWAL